MGEEEGEESEEEGAPKKGESLKLFVGNVPWSKDEEAALRKHFGKCGEIADMDLPNKLAFVTFKTKEGMEKALALHGKAFQGSELKIKKAIGKGEKDEKKDKKSSTKGKGKGKDKGK